MSEQSPHWANWSGEQLCHPATIERPRDERELCAVVAEWAPHGNIRALGTGHSFTGTCLTDGCLLDVSQMRRVLDVDPSSGLVRVQAGISIRALAEELAAHELALENQGDIDVQTLAGAHATGTHGTGLRFPNMSAQVVGCRLVTATGEVVEIDQGDEELRAARVSVGALGVLSELTLQAVPAFRVRKREEPRRAHEILAGLDEEAAAHDHYEVFFFPYSKDCLVLRSERTYEPARPLPRWREVLLDDLLANYALGLTLHLGRRFPQLVPRLGADIGRYLPTAERLDESYRVFPTPRRVKFTECEYAIPRAAAREVLERILALIPAERIPVNFPIELRYVAADDALLSPSHERESAYIAVHQFVGAEYERYFRAVEAIMDEFEGRPHWGKRHFQSAATLAPRYPQWERFQEIRRRLDPEGVFTNGYVARVLGPVTSTIEAPA